MSNNLLKLDEVTLPPLLNKHLSELQEIELKSIAFFFEIKILWFRNSPHEVTFGMANNGFYAIVKSRQGENLSMGRFVPRMVSYGGQYSFADAISTFRYFYCQAFEIAFKTNDYGPYTPAERDQLFLMALELVDIGIK